MDDEPIPYLPIVIDNVFYIIKRVKVVGKNRFGNVYRIKLNKNLEK